MLKTFLNRKVFGIHLSTSPLFIKREIYRVSGSSNSQQVPQQASEDFSDDGSHTTPSRSQGRPARILPAALPVDGWLSRIFR